MADFVKKVNRGVPLNQRSLSVDQSDVGAGDVVLVKDSLGRPARHISIDAVGAMSIRFNVYHKVYQQRKVGDGLTQWWPGLDNRTTGARYKDNTNAVVDIEAGETFALDGDLPVEDVEIISAAGNFSIVFF